MSTLSDVVEQALPRLRAVSEDAAFRKPAPEVWRAKQVLGHLIDSSVNNHARFVRAGAENGLALPDYDQNVWAAGGYQQRLWTKLVTLGFVATDDVRHQLHHLAQVRERAEG